MRARKLNEVETWAVLCQVNHPLLYHHFRPDLQNIGKRRQRAEIFEIENENKNISQALQDVLLQLAGASLAGLELLLLVLGLLGRPLHTPKILKIENENKISQAGQALQDVLLQLAGASLAGLELLLGQPGTLQSFRYEN